jgi:hypothetical protein
VVFDCTGCEQKSDRYLCGAKVKSIPIAGSETNARRAEREDERRTTQLIAGALAALISGPGSSEPGRREHIAELIHKAKLFKGRLYTAIIRKPGSQKPGEFNLLHAPNVPADTRPLLVKRPESKRLRQTYSVIGRELCEFKGNVAEFLRLIADKVEGKQSYSPGEDWYDRLIENAYLKACCLLSKKNIDAISHHVLVPPSFSEFWDIFQKQNPKAKLVSEAADLDARRSLKRKGYNCYTERSLRKSLKRLGCTVRPVKPGPKEKTQAKIEDGEFDVVYLPSYEVLCEVLMGSQRVVQSSPGTKAPETQRK